MKSRSFFWAILPVILVLATVNIQAANYLGYRWGTAQSPFLMQWGSNVNKTWAPLLEKAAINWSKSPVLDIAIVPGASSPTQCAITYGRVEICNAKYGLTGWYGVTQFVSTNGYISGASVKLNDSYRMTKEYKTMIACHETGHTFGLDHQDTMFGNTNLGTCLDYTNNPVGNMQPNDVDYSTLWDVYSQSVAVSTLSPTSAVQMALVDRKSPRNWGKMVRESKNKNELMFIREMGRGQQMVSFVTLVPGQMLRDEDQYPQLAF